MKTCGQCKLEKSFDSFHKRKASKDGRAATCKECHRAYKAQYYKDNKPKLLKQMNEYALENKESIREYLKDYYLDYYPKNRDRYSERCRARQQGLNNSTPSWLTEEHRQQIKEFYWLAKDLQAVTGETYHVDHIIPLKGENVSGLNVPWNLQVLPADINLKKGNKYEP